MLDMLFIPPVISKIPLRIELVSKSKFNICLSIVLMIIKVVIIPNSNSNVLHVLKILLLNISLNEELLLILFLCILFTAEIIDIFPFLYLLDLDL